MSPDHAAEWLRKAEAARIAARAPQAIQIALFTSLTPYMTPYIKREIW